MKKKHLKSKSTSEIVNHYFDIEDWNSAKNFLLTKLKKEPNNHWIITQLGESYYELREYETALKYTKKAVNLAPNCPLALNNYAVVLYIHEKDHLAIKIWKSLLSRKTKNIAFDECGEGINATKSLLNDIRMRLAKAYLAIDDKQKARKYFKKYLENRQKGLFSNFTKREAKKELKKLNNINK